VELLLLAALFAFFASIFCNISFLNGDDEIISACSKTLFVARLGLALCIVKLPYYKKIFL